MYNNLFWYFGCFCE